MIAFGSLERRRFSRASWTRVYATSPDEVRERLVRTVPLDRHSGNTITDRAAFRAEIERVHKRGYAIADEELATVMALR